MHDSEPADLLAQNRTDQRACVQCHESFGDPDVLTRHTRHGRDSSGSDCYNCHMPHTTYGVLTAIRSHEVSSPSVADELATGRPNACNLCHLDRTLEWTADHLANWYGRPKPPIPEEARGIADGVRLALTGDAGQRALLAWHLGWAPARATSGVDWIPPVLGVLLDDPYAAVRCVAERSLKSTSPLLPNGYDFVIDPATRPPAREAVWRAWIRESGAGPGRSALPPAVLVRPESVGVVAGELEPWLRRRNDRPMRLRE